MEGPSQLNLGPALLFHKPYEVLSQFTPVPDVYAAGRRYSVHVEGEARQMPEALESLRGGLIIQLRPTLPAGARILAPEELAASALAPRDPPIRHRKSVPTRWPELELREGRNRQVRRLTAAVGLSTLSRSGRGGRAGGGKSGRAGAGG